MPGPKSPLEQLSENVSATSSTSINSATSNHKNATRIVEECSNVEVTSSSSKKKSNFVYCDVLGGVVAYVEVRSETEDLSLLFGEHLLYLGATVSRTFTKKVTHVVFKRGKESTFNKAKSLNIPVVSIVWVDRCKTEKCNLPVDPYLIKEYKTYGKRLKLLYNYKHTRTVAENEKSFEEAKRMIENIKSRKPEGDVTLAPETPNENGNKLVSPIDSQTPTIIPETIFPDTTKKKNSKKIKKNLKKLDPTKKKLFVDNKDLFFGSPISKSTPLSNKIQRSHSPLNEPKAKILKLNKADRKENENYSEINTKTMKNELESSEILKCRRSLDDFKISKPYQSLARRKRKNDKETKTMVFTSFNAKMNDTAYAVVKALGGFQIIKNVTKNTTHVICGENKRTLNLLYGLMHRCFILDQEWLMSSLEAGKWLDEKFFELIEYYPSAQVRKLEIHNIFRDCGIFFVSPDSSPPAHDLTNLIKLGGGEVTYCYRKATIIVGNFKNHSTEQDPNITHVDEKSILDCISGFKKFKC